MGELISLGTVAELLRQAGVTVAIRHTGGNTATLYAGTPQIDQDGDAWYPVSCGPGFFAGPGRSEPMAFRWECSYGPADDDTDGPCLMVEDSTTEADIAAGIVAILAAGN